MRSLPKLLAAVPEADVVISARRRGPGYGTAPPVGKTWAEVLLEEGSTLDGSRAHLVGRVPDETLIDLMTLLSERIYFNYPS